MSPHRCRPAAALLVALLVMAACGSRMDHQELLDANEVTVSARSSSADPSSGAEGDTTEAGAGEPGAGSTPSISGSPTGGQTGTGSGATPSGGSGDQAASVASTPGETGPILIGSVGNYSGPAGAAAVGMPKGVQVWANQVNDDGGLFGRPVELIVVDDRGDPAQHLSAVRNLVENRKVVAFVGNYAPLTAPAATAYLAGKGVPVIGFDCTIDEYQKRPEVYFSPCGPTDGVQANVLRAAVTLGLGSKVAILFCGEAQVCKDADAAAGRVAKSAGIPIVYRSQISLVQPDFTSECISARNAGADAVFAISDPNGVARFAASCARQGYRPQMLGSGNLPANAPSLTGLETALIALSTFHFTGSPLPAAKEFYDAWDRYADGARGPSAGLGWASSQIFELAATRAARSSQSISPKTLVEALRTIKGEDLGGITAPLDYSGAFAVPNCYWPLRGADGGWTALNGGRPICL